MPRYFEIKAEVEKATEKSFFGLFSNFKKVNTLSLDEKTVAANKLAVDFAKEHNFTNPKVESAKLADGFLIVRVSVT